MPSKRPPAFGDDFYLAVGKCITAWAKVEEALFDIVHECLGPYQQSAIVYYRTPSLEARFNLADELVRSVLPKTEPGRQHNATVKAWTAAKERYDKLLSTRRRIAHQPVRAATTPTGSPPDKDRPIFWLQISTSRPESARVRSDHRPLITGDLEKHLVEVTALSERLRRFYDDVLTKRT